MLLAAVLSSPKLSESGKRREDYLEAIVLAGGLGTRLRSVVDKVPKTMAPINGKPFLEYLISYWEGQGVERFILSIGYLGSLVEEYFGDKFRNASIGYVREESPMGTGGALLKALGTVRDDKTVLLLNGDTLFAVDLNKFRSFHKSTGSEFSLSLFPSTNQRYAGVKINGEGRISSLGIDGSLEERFVNGGVYLFDKESFADVGFKNDGPCSLESDLLPIILRDGHPVFGCVSDSFFIDIGIPEDYARFDEFCRTGKINYLIMDSN